MVDNATIFTRTATDLVVDNPNVFIRTVELLFRYFELLTFAPADFVVYNLRLLIRTATDFVIEIRCLILAVAVLVVLCPVCLHRTVEAKDVE
jgi:hypothetical protein